jgi:ABC-type amino acid transport substrate-binding protein
MSKHQGKYRVFVFALVLTLFPAICGNPAHAADVSWQDELLAKGTLLVGMCTDYPPYESLNIKGEIEGFDVDMAVELAKSMGLALEIKQLGFQEIIAALQFGQVDIGISAFSYKEDRDVLFSTPYIMNDQVMVVEKRSGITSLKELSGKKIGAGTGTSCEAAAMASVPDGIFSSPGDYAIMFAALANGALDAVACNDQVAKNYTESNAELVTLSEIMATEGTHVIAQKGHDKLLERVNVAVEAFVNSSEYAAALAKWGII